MSVGQTSNWSDWRGWITEVVKKHDATIYEDDGRDKPCVMTRVDRLERDREHSARNTRLILRMLIGVISLLTAVIALAADLVRHLRP